MGSWLDGWDSNLLKGFYMESFQKGRPCIAGFYKEMLMFLPKFKAKLTFVELDEMFNGMYTPRKLSESWWHYKIDYLIQQKQFNQTNNINFLRSRTRLLDYYLFHFLCNGSFPVQSSADQTSVNENGQFMWDGHVPPSNLFVRIASGYNTLPPGRTAQNRRADTVHKQSRASIETKDSFQHSDTHAVRQKRKCHTDEWAKMWPHRFHRSDQTS